MARLPLAPFGWTPPAWTGVDSHPLLMALDGESLFWAAMLAECVQCTRDQLARPVAPGRASHEDLARWLEAAEETRAGCEEYFARACHQADAHEQRVDSRYALRELVMNAALAAGVAREAIPEQPWDADLHAWLEKVTALAPALEDLQPRARELLEHIRLAQELLEKTRMPVLLDRSRVHLALENEARKGWAIVRPADRVIPRAAPGEKPAGMFALPFEVLVLNARSVLRLAETDGFLARAQLEKGEARGVLSWRRVIVRGLERVSARANAIDAWEAAIDLAENSREEAAAIAAQLGLAIDGSQRRRHDLALHVLVETAHHAGPAAVAAHASLAALVMAQERAAKRPRGSLELTRSEQETARDLESSVDRLAAAHGFDEDSGPASTG